MRVTTTKTARRTESEADRARRRAAFLATLRTASNATQTALATRRQTLTRTSTRHDPPERATATNRADSRVTAAPARTRTVAVAAPPAQAASAQPGPQLFREEALRQQLAGEEARGLVHVSPPWAWALVCTVVAGLATALVTSFVARVDVTSRGRGIVRPAAGIRALTSQLGGTVTRVDARSGERVRKGAALLTIDSASMQAQLLEAERELEDVRTRHAAIATEQDRRHAEQVEHLESRARRLRSQIESLRQSEAYYQRRLQADNQLLRKGLVSELAVGEWRESLGKAQREISLAESTLDQTRQELASLQSRRQEDLWQRQQLVTRAQAKRDSLAVVMRQSVVEAPADGTVEALLVKVGEAVQAGQVIGKVIPADSPLRVVSFLAERDRAFVKAGDEVRLELDQLPHAEYGTLRGRILRIGDDLASPPEVQDALGDAQKLEAPSYRVEIEITDATAAEVAQVKLRTGALMNVRYTLKSQKLVSLAFSPLRRWFR